MTLYKAGASKQTAPGGGPGSFPTPVGARGGRAEASFKGRGDEEAACMEENNNRSRKERRENDNGTKRQFLGRLMETALSSVYGGWDFSEPWGLGRGEEAVEDDVFFAAIHCHSTPGMP